MQCIKRWLRWTIVAGLMQSFLGGEQIARLLGSVERAYSWLSNPHHGALVFVAISVTIVSVLLKGRH
jgi:hypothetical protein